jgi:DNA-directed RNA polymerase specialized sigma24 family protein
VVRKRPAKVAADEPASDQSERLRRLTNLVALLLVKGESQNEKIRTLDAAGYQPKEIAELLGTTSNTVRVTLHNLRKKRV